MADREKVIKGLECCTRGDTCFSDCPYFKEVPMTDGRCITAVQADALALLKAPEAVEPEKLTVLDFGSFETTVYLCGSCRMPIERGDVYCKHCGKKVRWDG